MLQSQPHLLLAISQLELLFDMVTDAKVAPLLQTVVLGLVACLEVWVACQVGQVECQTWVVLVALAVPVDPLLRKSTKFCNFNR